MQVRCFEPYLIDEISNAERFFNSVVPEITVFNQTNKQSLQLYNIR